MKSPAKQMRDSLAYERTDAFIQGIDSDGAAGEARPQTIAGE
jgi:hypothetical protein